MEKFQPRINKTNHSCIVWLECFYFELTELTCEATAENISCVYSFSRYEDYFGTFYFGPLEFG